ncbi:hypothetical protein [Halobacillus karajensis]|uniref:hypothetical protein n=1 Tax=Halobacillus karajensis TaxID=195088 RepID=UPI001428C450|nr:hypothetical protein [Halobacillus karajensis]
MKRQRKHSYKWLRLKRKTIDYQSETFPTSRLIKRASGKIVPKPLTTNDFINANPRR